jgi:hypothetical protein
MTAVATEVVTPLVTGKRIYSVGPPEEKECSQEAHHVGLWGFEAFFPHACLGKEHEDALLLPIESSMSLDGAVFEVGHQNAGGCQFTICE